MENTRIREPSFTDDQMADIARCCATLGVEKAKAIDWDIVASAINARSPENPRIDPEECRHIVNFYMRKHGYREHEIDASATSQRAHDLVREEVEPNHEHAQERQNSMKTAFLPNDETIKSQGKSETISRDGKPITEEVGEQRSVNNPRSPESFSIPQKQHVDQEDGLEGSRQHDQPSTANTPKDRPKPYCSTM